MSAYVVTDETMTKALKAIAYRPSNYFLITSFAGHRLDRDATAAQFDATMTKIGRELFALNYQAVGERYNESAENLDAGYQFSNNDFRTGRIADLVVNVKALHSLIYQCSEGNAMESPLFKALVEADGVLCQHIVCEMAEYKAAAWG